MPSIKNFKNEKKSSHHKTAATHAHKMEASRSNQQQATHKAKPAGVTESNSSDAESAAKRRRPGRESTSEAASKATREVTSAAAKEAGREKKIEVIDVEMEVAEQVGVDDAVSAAESQASLAQHLEANHDKNVTENHSEDHIDEHETPEASKDNSHKIEINFPGSEVLRAKLPGTFEVADQIATDWVNDGRFEELPLKSPLAQYFVAKGLRQAKDVEKKIMNSPTTEKVAMNVFTAALKVQGAIQQIKSKVDEVRGGRSNGRKSKKD